MKPKILLLLIITGLLWSALASAAQNPFVSGKKKDVATDQKSSLRYPQFLHPVLSKITAWQRILRKYLTTFGKEIREQSYGKAFWYFLGFSFVYGVIHALGPGHGKTIVVSYFLSRPGKYLHGIFMGNLLTFVHVFSAVSIILSVHFIVKTTGMSSFESISRNLERISYSMLILIGLILLGKYLYDLKQGHTHHEENLQQDTQSIKHLILTAFVTGLVPCPGAALILIFTLSQQILPVGLFAMFCVAFGMGLTTTIFALLAIASRHSLLHLMNRHQQLFAFSHAFLSISGALIITCIGGLLFFGRG